MTTFIYIFILFFSTFTALLYEKSKSKNFQFIFLSFTYFVPLTFMALRYHVGIDYNGYESIFNIIKSGQSSYVEPGFVILNKIVQYFDFNVEGVVFISSVIFMTFSYKAIPKNGFAIGIFLLISYYYFLGGYNQIRQGMVVAIMTYALKYIYGKNMLIYMFFAFISLSLHFVTALIFILIYFIANRHISKYFLISIVVVAYFIYITNAIANVVDFIVNIFIPNYKHYLTSKFGMAISTNFIDTKVLPFINLLIGVWIFFHKDIVIKKFPIANIYINLFAFYLSFYFFRYNMIILERIQFTFILSTIIMVIYIIKTFSTESRKMILFVLSIISFLYFTISFTAPGRHMYPYKTILFDKD